VPKNSFTRRDVLRGLVAAPLVAVSATAAYARLIEPYNYWVSETDIFISDLPPAFEGFRITQLTDIHHSRILGISEVRRVVNLAQQTKPDMFVLTGDYSTTYRRYIEPCAEALSTLSAPEGVWAVLGNHDHYTDPELTTRALQRHHIAVLNNAHTTLQRRSDSLQLSGIDDWSWNATDWARAFSGLKTKAPTILLSHQPMVFDFEQIPRAPLILPAERPAPSRAPSRSTQRTAHGFRCWSPTTSSQAMGPGPSSAARRRTAIRSPTSGSWETPPIRSTMT